MKGKGSLRNFQIPEKATSGSELDGKSSHPGFVPPSPSEGREDLTHCYLFHLLSIY